MLEKLFIKFINIACKIFEVYRLEGRFDEAVLFFDSIKPILDSKELRKEDKAKCLIKFAHIKADQKFFKDFNYNDEMTMLQEAQNLAESSNSKDILANALDLFGNCIYRKGILDGDFEEALTYYNKALSIRTQIKDKLGLSKSYFHIGLYHENKKDADEEDYKTSFEYYQKGLKIALEEDFKLEQSYFYRHLAGHYQFLKNDLDKALEYHKKSAELREEIGFNFSLQFPYHAIGFVYFMKNDFENSLVYFKKAYSAALSVNRIEAFKTLIFRRGEVIVRENGLEAALNYYDLLLTAAKNLNDFEGIKEIELKVKDLSKKE
ncbi:MAG: tetratricopeptide repeat protein [Promethearchaeota archaeon]|nr:MAG: tetratricopeptide repeat protein [Candidatus Lokiarchaeota archaeon]